MSFTTDTTAARESARQSTGQFGAQEHTAPELALPAARFAVDDAYDRLVTAAREGKLAKVDAAAAHMPEHIRGVRFIRRGPDAIPAFFIPTTPGGHVAGVGEYKDEHLYPVTAYVTIAPDLLDLNEVVERNGNPAWEWIPSPEQRALPALFADAAAADAARRFQAATDQFREAAAEHLRTHMPDGADTIVVAQDHELRDGVYHRVTVPVGAYDEDGELVPLDPQGPENAHYWETVKRFDFHSNHFPRVENAAGGIEYTISREGQL